MLTNELLIMKFFEITHHSTSNRCVLKCLKIINTKAWPKAKEDLNQFGCEELAVVLKHFFLLYFRKKLIVKRLKVNDCN